MLPPGPGWSNWARPMRSPGGLGVVDGGTIPYKPEALAKKKGNYANRLNSGPGDQVLSAWRAARELYALSLPDHSEPEAHHDVCTFAGAVRTIYMDDHKEAPADSWMGWSNGRWEGETLVVDTSGFNGQTWFDRAGNFHSDALHVVERFTAREPGPSPL